MLTPAEITKAIADIEAAISHRPNRGISVNSNAFVLRVLKQLQSATEERDRLLCEVSRLNQECGRMEAKIEAMPQAWLT